MKKGGGGLFYVSTPGDCFIIVCEYKVQCLNEEINRKRLKPNKCRVSG